MNEDKKDTTMHNSKKDRSINSGSVRITKPLTSINQRKTNMIDTRTRCAPACSGAHTKRNGEKFANVYSQVIEHGVIYYEFDRQINCISSF